MSKVAEKAGLERTHLYRKLKQLNIRFSRRSDDPPASAPSAAATATAAKPPDSGFARRESGSRR